MKRILLLLMAVLALTGCNRAQEIDPQFPGDIQGLYDFIERNLRYPEEAVDHHIEGRVYISFYIEESGYATGAMVDLGLPGGCSSAALDLVKRMPLWKPGGVRYSDGHTETRRVKFTMPVNFTLNPQSPSRTWSYGLDTTDIHYPGGTDALYRYLSSNIDWLSGKAVVKVRFDSTGHVAEADVDAPVDCQEEIRRAVLAMPPWIPGKCSRNLRVNIPIDLPLLASMRDTLLRPSFLKYDEFIWNEIIADEAYFRQLLALNDSLCAGYTVAPRRLQALMPQDKSHFSALCGVDYYVRSGFGMVIMEEMADLAIADSLDMMEHFVKWFNWTDGYVSEMVFDKAIHIEQRHPLKFRRLMQRICPDQWEGYEEWRNEYLEWEKENN